MENQDNNVNNIRYNFVNGKLLDNYTNSEGIVVGSDFHGGSGLENLLKTASENNLTAVVNGDVVNDYAFMQVANNIGYKSQSEIVFDYLSENLSEREMQTYFFLQNLEQTGGKLEPFLNNIPESNHEEFKKSVEATIKYSQTEIFQKTIENTMKKFQEEKGEEVQENTIKTRILYEIFMDAEAQNVANQINKYGTKVLFNKGNHENTLFVENVRKYLEKQENIVDLTQQKGLYTIKQSNGQDMTLAGMTNSVQSMPYLNEIMHPDESNFFYSHMNIDEIKEKAMLSGKVSVDDVEKLEELIKQDSDYNRLFENGETDLDLFLTHGQVGMPVFDNDKTGYEIPYHGVAAYLSNKANLTIEGHIHSWYNGKNSFDKDMIRPAGRYGAIVKKDEIGNLVKEKIELDSNYTGGQNNEITYDLNQMKDVVEKMYSEMISNQSANNSYYNSNSDEKAA